MPPEVLAEIFRWTLPKVPASARRFRIADSPWLLTHVSHRWRAIATGTPRLWASVDISYHNTQNPWARCPLPMLKTQTARAKKLKINFFGDESVAPEPQVEIFRYLAGHSSRWEELTITLTSALFPLLADLRNHLPSLRKLWIQWDDQARQEGMAVIDSFETAPSLVHAVINSIRFIPVPLPAHQLTRYYFEAPWPIHWALLQQAHNLVEADISVTSDSNSWPGCHKIIALPALRQLGLSHTEISNYLRVPVLETLSFSVVRNQPLVDIMALLDRSACTLRRLCISGAPSTPHTAEILASVPSIVELGIISRSSIPKDRRAFNAIMGHLTPPAGATPIAPHLRVLLFGCEELKEDFIDYKMAHKMLDARWSAAGSALESAALVSDAKSGLDYLSTSRRGLALLRQKGLNVLLLSDLQGSNFLQNWDLNYNMELDGGFSAPALPQSVRIALGDTL
ncbi:hypothetical protein C8R47DRAFT_1302596 [Mycena vitilis]|nr:hypothetical protein C8R47DRAFT_1302596 [Mycena vitilis]